MNAQIPISPLDVNIDSVAGRLLSSAGVARRGEHGDGLVIWITGLSGAGKTTVGSHLADRFRSRDLRFVALDGDKLRAALGAEAQHGIDDRLRLALTYGALCRRLATGGAHVICATISMFHEVQAWNRANIPGYVEVYLRVPVDVVRRRDPRGLYRENACGRGVPLVGIDIPAEAPIAPDLVIDNFGSCSAEAAAGEIWEFLVGSKNLLPGR